MLDIKLICNNDLANKYDKTDTHAVFQGSCIELKGLPKPFIDFHYNDDSGDYTSRLIENSKGELLIPGNLRIDGNLVVKNLVVTSIFDRYSSNIYQRTETNVSAGAGWNYVGSGVTVPFGVYMVWYYVEGPTLAMAGSSWEDYSLSLNNSSSGTFVVHHIDIVHITSGDSLLKACTYCNAATTLSKVRIKALRIY